MVSRSEHSSGSHSAAVFAHRGSSGLYPEHTRAAYLHAVAEGADGIEIDLHLTSDHQLVCMHDPTVDRTTNGTGAVAEHSLGELRSLDNTSWKKTKQWPEEYGAKDQQWMTLEGTLELLGTAGRDVRLAIELKHPSPAGQLLEQRTLETLRSYGWDPRTSVIPAGDHQVEVSFMSFSVDSLGYLAQEVPAEKLCPLFNKSSSEAHQLAKSRQVGLAGPSLPYVKRHRKEITDWVSQGIGLRVWTVDRGADAVKLVGMGVQEVTTNYPKAVLEALESDSAHHGG